MKLYSFPASPNTWKVRAVAAHLGLPLECEFVDLTKGASHTPAYLSVNPTGRTPALVDGDFTIKRYRNRGGQIRLTAENPAFADIPITSDSAFEVWGVVTHSIRML